MRWGTCVLLLLVVVPAVAAGPTADVVLGGPSEFTLTGGAVEPFPVQVQARLVCTTGFDPPADLRVRASQPGHAVSSGYLWRMVPDSVLLPWQRVRGETNAYQINTTVELDAVSEVAPEEPARENVSFLVETSRSPGTLGCSPDGYTLNAPPLRVVLEVDPAAEDAQTHAAERAGRPSLHWFPILLASVLLAAVGVFAAARERLRRN